MKTSLTINTLCSTIFHSNRKVGWWSDEDMATLSERDESTGKRTKEAVTLLASKLALVHSEVSEALEGLRKELKDDHLPDRDMFEVELADAVIRIFDIAGALDLDLGGAIVEKFEYNQNRQDHKLENRSGVGGKTI